MELTLSRWTVRLALWLVAALFAAAMTLAPASAHPGHADVSAKEFASHHQADASLAPQINVKVAAAVGSASIRQTVAGAKSSAIVSAVLPASDGCRGVCCGFGANCCGMGCCSAFLPADAPTIGCLSHAAAAHFVAPPGSTVGVEPDSLLEPPNFLA